MQADVDQDESFSPLDAEADMDQNESFLSPDAEIFHLDSPRRQRGAKSLDYWSEEGTIDLLEPLPLQQSDETAEINAHFSGERPSGQTITEGTLRTEHTEASSRLLIREDSTEVDSSPSVAHESSESAGSECCVRDKLQVDSSPSVDHEPSESAGSECSVRDDLQAACADPRVDRQQPVAQPTQQPGLQLNSGDFVVGPPESDAEEDASLKGRIRAVVMEFIEDIPWLW